MDIDIICSLFVSGFDLQRKFTFILVCWTPYLCFISVHVSLSLSLSLSQAVTDATDAPKSNPEPAGGDVGGDGDDGVDESGATRESSPDSANPGPDADAGDDDNAGQNPEGDVADGDATGASAVAVVANEEQVEAVAEKNSALLTDGRVRCWACECLVRVMSGAFHARFSLFVFS